MLPVIHVSLKKKSRGCLEWHAESGGLDGLYNYGLYSYGLYTSSGMPRVAASMHCSTEPLPIVSNLFCQRKKYDDDNDGYSND